MRVTFQRTLTDRELERLDVLRAVDVTVKRLRESGASAQLYDCDYGHFTIAIVGTEVAACECGDCLSPLALIEQDTRG